MLTVIAYNNDHRTMCSASMAKACAQFAGWSSSGPTPSKARQSATARAKLPCYHAPHRLALLIAVCQAQSKSVMHVVHVMYLGELAAAPAAASRRHLPRRVHGDPGVLHPSHLLVTRIPAYLRPPSRPKLGKPALQAPKLCTTAEGSWVLLTLIGIWASNPATASLQRAKVVPQPLVAAARTPPKKSCPSGGAAPCFLAAHRVATISTETRVLPSTSTGSSKGPGSGPTGVSRATLRGHPLCRSSHGAAVGRLRQRWRRCLRRGWISGCSAGPCSTW